jgi:CheY-like chemotaxis protein
VYDTFQPDLILLDLMMPHLDGYSGMQQIGPRVPEGSYLPILVRTAEVNPEAKCEAILAG